MNSSDIFSCLKAALHDPGRSSIEITGLSGGAVPWLVARFAALTKSPILLLTEDEKRAEVVASDLSFFTDLPVLRFPAHEFLPFVPILPQAETAAMRISSLYGISNPSGPFILVASAQALFESTIPRGVLAASVEYIEAGEETDRDALVAWLVRSGYERVSLVQLRGEFSVRGGVLDVFPPGTELPIRVDFFGDLVEGIQRFHPLTQRSVDGLSEFVFLPAREIVLAADSDDALRARAVELATSHDWEPSRIHDLLHHLETGRLVEGYRALLPLFHGRALLFDHLPTEIPVFALEADRMEAKMKAFRESAETAYKTALQEHRVLFPLDDLVAPVEEVVRGLRTRSFWFTRELFLEGPSMDLIFGMSGEARAVHLKSARPAAALPPPVSRKGEDILGPVFETVRSWAEGGNRVVIVVPGERHGERMRALLRDHEVPDLAPVAGEAWSPVLGDPEGSGVRVVEGNLSEGFSLLVDRLVYCTEAELFGTPAARRPARRRRKATVGDVVFEELSPGDHVVHRDHGVGLYLGLERMSAGGVDGEYLLIEYRGGDRLYLPVDRLGLVEKYVGIEGREPVLDKLGGSTFALSKQKAKRAVYEIAHELVDLYARRQAGEGIAFSPPDAMFREFESAFPYEETPDQAASIEEILQDMESPRPMDRLLCGDVGYGKTEVVMRAAFKAVLDGKQVAVLVPTTLLAEQHARTFTRRFRNFPVEIRALSRLTPRKGQREILEKTGKGGVDILIGTHRLLQADVHFKDLGLLVIDEEHRFGVRHKERLKQLKSSVDCLTLTATPIPRTLQLSLIGLRDLSIINTPPHERLPIKTFLAGFDDAVIREAVIREIERGGQVFFVHNRVKGIHRIAEHVSRLVPAARVAVGHGQMAPDELEDVMIRFVRGEIDCLVCTTIIESGLDIPTANTILIDRADTIGVADLYQLRGRVGRSAEQAYAYLIVPRPDEMPEDVSRRLKAIMELSGADGGGFRLAMQDLQARGAGNILGVAQSGSIAEVGYDLYLDLLTEAVEEIRGTPRVAEIDPEINVGIAAYIPDGYVQDVEQRLRLYRRLARLANEVDARELWEEMEDRYGPLPPEVETLFQVMALKRALRVIPCVRLDRTPSRDGRPSACVFHFLPSEDLRTDLLVRIAEKRRGWRLTPDGRLIAPLESGSLEELTQVVGLVADGMKGEEGPKGVRRGTGMG